jgi:hypothetical protein
MERSRRTVRKTPRQVRPAVAEQFRSGKVILVETLAALILLLTILLLFFR